MLSAGNQSQRVCLADQELRQALPQLQVRHAQQAGAAAAIVYDNAYEPLIIMSKPAGHTSPGIPAVFISQKSGIIMKKLMTPGVTIAHIMPVRARKGFRVLGLGLGLGCCSGSGVCTPKAEQSTTCK
jgi:PA domain